MLKEKTQIHVLVEKLQESGFSVAPDFKKGIIELDRLPEFTEKLVFSLTITMDHPESAQWENLFDACSLISGRIRKGSAHGSGIYSRKKAVERARQEKWVASWALLDAGILPQAEQPCDRWEDVALP